MRRNVQPDQTVGVTLDPRSSTDVNGLTGCDRGLSPTRVLHAPGILVLSVDIVADGFHAGVRLGDSVQEDMIAVRLTPDQRGILVASPDYLERRCTPRDPGDLVDHDCLRRRARRSGRIVPWRFSEGGEFVSRTVSGPLVLDDLRTVIDAARLGLGIGWSLHDGVAEDLAQGRLVEVLAEHAQPRPGFFLYFPRSLASTQVLRAFIDHFGLADSLPATRSSP